MPLTTSEPSTCGAGSWKCTSSPGKDVIYLNTTEHFTQNQFRDKQNQSSHSLSFKGRKLSPSLRSAASLQHQIIILHTLNVYFDLRWACIPPCLCSEKCSNTFNTFSGCLSNWPKAQKYISNMNHLLLWSLHDLVEGSKICSFRVFAIYLSLL